MPENNPQFGNENAPNWTGASKGFTPDTSGADLFRGISDALEMGVKAADTFFQNSFKDEARSSVDSVQNKYGSQPFINAEGDKLLNNNPDAPPEAKKQAEKAAKIQKSYANGELTESRYWAELDNISRQLRSRYPAYRDQIDTYMSHLTGAIPANRLIQEVRQEQMKTNKDAAHYDALVQKAAFDVQVGGLPQDFYTRKAAGQPYTMDELTNFVSQRTAIQSKIHLAQSGFALRAAQNTATREEGYQSANFAFANNRYTMVENAVGGPSNYNKFLDLMDQAARERTEKGVISREMEAQITNQFAIMRTQADAQFNKLMTQKQTNGFSWDSTLDKESKAKLRADHDDFFKQLEDGITSKAWGTVGSRLRYMEGRHVDDRLNLEGAGIIRSINAMKETLGPDAVNWYLSRTEKSALPAIDKAMVDFVRTNTLQKAGDAANKGQYDTKNNIGTSFDELKAKGVSNSAAYKSVLDDHINVITDPEAPEAIKKGALLSIYGPANAGFLNKLNESDRQLTFMKLTSPRITKVIKDTGDERLFQNYVRWSTDSIVGLNITTIGSLKSGGELNQAADISYDPATKQFEIIPKPVVPIPGIINYKDVNATRLTGIRESINQLSSQMQQLYPIWKASGQDDVKMAQNFFAQAKLPIIVKSPDKTSSGKDNTRVQSNSFLSNFTEGDNPSDTIDPTVRKAGDIANAFSDTEKVNADLWDKNLIDSLMTKKEKADPEERAMIQYEFSPGSPVYGMYSMRLVDKLEKEANQLDNKDPNMWSDAEAERYSKIQDQLAELRAKKEDFFVAQQKGNHDAIIARHPSWSTKGSVLREVQKKYREDNSIPEGQNIAKRFRDFGWNLTEEDIRQMDTKERTTVLDALRVYPEETDADVYSRIERKNKLDILRKPGETDNQVYDRLLNDAKELAKKK